MPSHHTLTAFCLLLTTSCTAAPASVPSEPRAASIAGKAGRTARETLRLRRLGNEAACAAVVVGEKHAVTALHCARWLCNVPADTAATELGGCSLEFQFAGGAAGRTTVVGASAADHLALLELRQAVASWVSLRCDPLAPGEPMYTVGHPRQAAWSPSYGHFVRGPESIEWADGGHTSAVVAELPTGPGWSGGGLFDSIDRLVGVQVQRWSPWTGSPNLAAFVHAERIMAIFEGHCGASRSEDCPRPRCAADAAPVGWADSRRLQNLP